jgi:2-dehydro-3-deoxyglucarate aldolase/4-hydroxy-2-oxoheptanedioate aldolase
MNTPAIKKLRQTLAADRPSYGLWITLESASITEMAVALGLDWVVIDAEHGHLDWKDILDHLRATVRSKTVALVRIAELNVALVKRALDIGADGVVVPWIESVEQVEQAVAFAHYPPDGRRGIGAERATCWGRCFGEHVAEADEHVLVVPIIESVRAGRDIESLCKVPGVEIFFIGPADFSSTAGYPGQWEGPGVAERILHVKDTVRRHGKQCGLLATSNDNLVERREQGFRMLGVGIDSGMLLRGLSGALAAVERERRIVPTFEPENLPQPPSQPAVAVPQTMLPDRPEAMSQVQAATRVEIERGVIFQPLVGAHNDARNLTTGIINFLPGAELPYHVHPHAEAVTVLSGRLAFEVEGRRYVLNPLDNVYVAKETPHHAANLSANQPAVAHIAMASHSPRRTLVERTFVRREMPGDAGGQAGAERINRHATTNWYEPAQGARFQDFYNRDLGCPEMSGGYGLFQPDGRLPCHIHDFDESITIIQGTATCVVEGHRYRLADNATALCPRGRCHYFINETRRPMAMLWVYAGPLPQRLVMQESCCQP